MPGRLRPHRIADAVAHLDADAPSEREMRRRLLDVLARVVPHDWYAFLLTDPETKVGCSPLAEVPDLSALPRLIRLKYLTQTNRWTHLAARPAAALQAATQGAPEQSLLWRDLLRGLGVVDVLSAVFADRHGCWGFLDLWRDSGPFTGDEVIAVAEAAPAIAVMLRSAAARGFPALGPPTAPEQAGAHDAGAGVLVLSPDLLPRVGTPQTSEWLRRLLPTPAGQDPVPASAFNVAAQLLAVEAGVDSHRPLARVHLGNGKWLVLRADRLVPSRDGIGDIAVAYEQAGAADRLELFVRAHGMTPRERDLVRQLATGADTRQAARRLGISELTVQDHLKSVFSRTSSSSRGELLARALGS